MHLTPLFQQKPGPPHFLPSSGQIGSLQATQMSHEATIRNLDQEQSRLKERIGRLEEEREALLNQSQSANEQHKQQVHKLEQVNERGWTVKRMASH